MSERVIVVGLDGSPPSAAALRWAVEQAKTRGALVRAIHVYGPPAISHPLAPELRAEVEAAARREASDWVIDALGDRMPHIIRVDAIPGEPGPVLVEAADGADLLVLGVRAYGKHSYLTVPKIARYCLGRSRAPVVVVPAAVSMEVARSA